MMSNPTPNVIPPPFKSREYFASLEHPIKYWLCSSDAEAFTMQEILDLADPECKELWTNLSLQYTDVSGHPLLRDEIVKLYDHKISKNDVLVTSPQEGIFIAMGSLVSYFRNEYTNEGVHAIVASPAFQSLIDNLTTLNCEVSKWSIEPSSKGWQFNLDGLEELVTKNTRLLVLNLPHNPLGFVPTLEEWMQIVNWCKSKDIFLFCDEIYWLTNNDGSKPLPSACMVDYDRTMCVSGLSKAYGLPGVRIGWLCTKFQPVMKLLHQFKSYTSMCSSAPSEILSIIALRSKEVILNRTLGIIKENLKTLDEFFQKYPDLFKWRKPQAGTIGFLEIKGWLLNLGEGGATGFCKVLLQDTGVVLLPSQVFTYEDKFVRLGFARRSLPKALEALEEFITSKNAN